jgi:ribonuclease P protein component
MLTRSHRFHGYGSLRHTYNQGKTVRGQLISLRYATRPTGKPYRVAVVVSRKVHKSAVVRNRIRRRVYEWVRQCETVPAATDLVFTVFSDQITRIEAEQLNSIMSELLTKASQELKKSV